jgi:1-phosphatidylinositol-4-phosphate 5-kinase
VSRSNAKIDFRSTIQSYEDQKFDEIQKLDGISPEDLMKSLSMEDNRNCVFTAGEGAGKSGSFFFFTQDNRFLIKTLKGKEK